VAASATRANVSAWRLLVRWPMQEESAVFRFNRAGDALYGLSSEGRCVRGCGRQPTWVAAAAAAATAAVLRVLRGALLTLTLVAWLGCAPPCTVVLTHTRAPRACCCHTRCTHTHTRTHTHTQ
jgi:hypothetical protein